MVITTELILMDAGQYNAALPQWLWYYFLLLFLIGFKMKKVAVFIATRR